jgi:toxin-antitoxin system PIN domain toxin
MSVEAGLIDANVLVYAMDGDSPHHVASRGLLDAAIEQSVRLCVTSQVLCEFYSIVTNGRRVTKPRSPADAIGAITEMLAFLEVLPVPVRAVQVWLDLLRRRRVTGGDVFDLQLAATMLANDVARIYTFNGKDFEMFAELTVATP